MSLDLARLGDDVAGAFVGAAEEFYADGRAMAAEDRAFFQEIAADYREAGLTLVRAKATGDASLVAEMEGTLRQLTGTVRSRVAERRLDLEDSVKGALGNALWGVAKAVGTILGGAIAAAL